MGSTTSGAAPVPQKAIDFLGRKVNVETEKWDDLKWGEHAHALTVAHSAGAGVLDEIHRLLNDAVEKGISYQEFRNGMLDMMKASGWYGGAEHTEKDRRYINWRIGVIYDTNMSTAYDQADYRDRLEGADLRPIWVYRSQLAGDNRRQEHIALHGKAFRYDDSFWDTYTPRNGWRCECYVDTESEYSAKQNGIEVLRSNDNGTPPVIKDKDGNTLDWKKVCPPEWRYNVGREALAPNFSKYTNLPKDALTQIYKNYHQSMNGTRMTEGEFRTLLKRTNEKDFKPLNIQYQVGTLEAERYEAVRRKGVQDCKITATGHDLWHGTGDKNSKQKIPERLFNELYTAFQEPENIYREKTPARTAQEQIFHLVKDTGDGKKIKIIVHVRILGNGQTSMQVRTMGYAEYDYTGGDYEKIW